MKKILTTSLLLAMIVAPSPASRSADCNGNGIDDASDILPRDLGFLATPSYPVEGELIYHSLIAADLDGDDTPDLVTLTNRSVSVFLTHADGTLEAAVDYLVEGLSLSLIAADLNGDGKSDLAIATVNYDSLCQCYKDGNVSVLINQGDGTFQAAVSYPVGNTHFLTAADLNGDGKRDLVTTNYGCQYCHPKIPGDVSVLINRGDGTFQAAVKYPVGGYPYPLIVADLNGDGKLDIATANQFPSDFGPPVPGDVAVLLNQGDGTYEAAVSYPVGVNPGSLVAADFNGDGKPDLVAVNWGCSSCSVPIPGGVSVLINHGDGTFKDAVSYLGGYPYSIVVADITGDGQPDLAALISGGVSVLINRGDGTFKDALSYAIGGSGSPLSDLIAADLIATDLNGDGKLDLAVTVLGKYLGAGRVIILLNQGDGTFKTTVSYIVGSSSPYSLIAADLNGDGMPDLVTASENWCEDTCGPPFGGNVSVLLNQDDGTFMGTVGYGSGGRYPLSFIAADLNGDVKPDLATLTERGTLNSSSVSVFLTHADGTLEDAASYPVGGFGGFAGGRGSSSLIAVDLNGDEKPDLATANESNGGGGVISILINKGDAIFEAAVEYPVEGTPRSMIAVDLNGDGKPSIAIASGIYDVSCFCVKYGTVSILLNQGDGTFPRRVDYSVGGGPSSLFAADLNSDGATDLTTANLSYDPTCNCLKEGSVSILFNQGDGNFEDAVDYPVGSDPIGLTAADLSDLNDDGKPDLTIATATYNFTCGCYVDGTVNVFINQGDDTFKDALSFAVGVAPRYLTAADLNGDGKPDLVTLNNSSVSILFNRGDGTFEDAASYLIEGLQSSLIAADLNGDGKLDIATANKTQSQVSILLNQGDATFQEAVSYLVGGRPSSLITADFNGDRKFDLATVVGGFVEVLLSRSTPPFSFDVNHNGIPDECETRFHRGDPNSSGTTDISDGITVFGFLFLGNPATLSCNESADVNNDGTIDISDGVSLLNWLFIGGPAPVVPGSTDMPCGFDPDPAGSPGDLGCVAYGACE